MLVHISSQSLIRRPLRSTPLLRRKAEHSAAPSVSWEIDILSSFYMAATVATGEGNFDMKMKDFGP